MPANTLQLLFSNNMIEFDLNGKNILSDNRALMNLTFLTKSHSAKTFLLNICNKFLESTYIDLIHALTEFQQHRWNRSKRLSKFITIILLKI